MRRTLQSLILALTVPAILAAVYFVPVWQVHQYKIEDQEAKSLNPKELADLENKFRGTLATAIGGSLVIVGLWFTLQQYVLSRRQVAAAEENVRISEKSKNLDRIKAAVDYMGSDFASKKIAGVTILGNLALESPEDIEPVLQTFLHYMEERIPFRDRDSELPSDIALTLRQISAISRRHQQRIVDPLLFRGFDLRDATLRGLFITNACFKDLNLENTTFVDSTFNDVEFIKEANTSAVKFSYCRLTDVEFSGVKLTLAHFQGSVCENVHFDVSDIEGGGLADARFKNCGFAGVSFKNASLYGTAFDGCVLYGAKLEEANFLTSEQLTSSRTLYQATMPEPISQELRQRVPCLFEPPKVITIDSAFYGVAFFHDGKGAYRTGRAGKEILRREIVNFDDDEYENAVRALTRERKKFWIGDDRSFWKY